jgi:hypothetical protein
MSTVPKMTLWSAGVRDIGAGSIVRAVLPKCPFVMSSAVETSFAANNSRNKRFLDFARNDKGGQSRVKCCDALGNTPF